LHVYDSIDEGDAFMFALAAFQDLDNGDKSYWRFLGRIALDYVNADAAHR